jgi:hypothetical protein
MQPIENVLELRAPAANAQRGRSRVLRALIWTAILLLFAFAFYLVFGRKEEPKVRPAAAITTTTATAQKGNIGDYLDAIGTVTPVYTASIFSQVWVWRLASGGRQTESRWNVIARAGAIV